MPAEEKLSTKKRLEKACENEEFRTMWHNVIKRYAESKNLLNNENEDETMMEDPSTMSDSKIRELMTKFYLGRATLLYKTDYPFYTDGIIVKSFEFQKELDVYSRRLGRFKMKDDPERKECFFAYWMEVGDNERRGLTYDPTPDKCLKTVKFDKKDKFSVMGSALLGHSRDSNEAKWVGWNDRIGWMRGCSRAARLSKAKHSEIGFSVEVVKFTAKYNDSFEMINITLLTDPKFQETDFPKEAVYVQDLVLTRKSNSKMYFTSESLRLSCVIDENQTMDDVKPNVTYEGVIVPHFVSPLELEWRGLMLATPETAKQEKFDTLRFLAMKNKVHLFGKDNNDNFESSTDTRSSIVDISVIREED